MQAIAHHLHVLGSVHRPQRRDQGAARYFVQSVPLDHANSWTISRKLSLFTALNKLWQSRSIILKQRIQWLLHDNPLIWSADRIIAISEMMAQDLISVVDDIPSSRICRIYHGVDPKFRRVEDIGHLDQTRSKYNLPSIFVLFVGKIYPQKNFATVLCAGTRSPGVPHHIVVAMPRWRFDQDLTLVDRLGLRDRVHFLGLLLTMICQAIHTAACHFVFPSFYEAFGLAGVEAMACGCP